MPPPFNLNPGNWTAYIQNSIGANLMEKLTSVVKEFSGAPGDNIAPACTSPKEFNATYKCGENAEKSISIIGQEAGNQSVTFDCTTEYNKCNNFRLTLADSGALTLTDGADKILWQNTNASAGMPLDKFKAINGKFKRNYLKGGEFLGLYSKNILGQWNDEFLGSPTGTCRLVFVDETVGTAADAITLNPSESSRSYSSVWDGNWIGYGHARSMLDSPQAWSAQYNNTNQWMTLDLGSSVKVSSIITQGRQNYPQWVTTYYVKYSTNNSTWNDVDGNRVFNGNTNQTTKVENIFNTPVQARYIKIMPIAWYNHVSMRAGVGINSPRKTRVLKIVYEREGCNTETPINIDSIELSKITGGANNIDSLGKMGYVNESGKLRAYPNSMTSFTNNYRMTGNYNLMGGNNQSFKVDNVDQCKVKCNVNTVKCSGFTFDETPNVATNCNLKLGDGGMVNDQYRVIDNNYKYYARSKSVTNDISCPSTLDNQDIITTTEWNRFTQDKRDVDMTPTTTCNLKKYTKTERDILEEKRLALKTITDKVKNSISKLNSEEAKLTQGLLDNAEKLLTAKTQIKDYRENKDWTGKQLEQLNAQEEDRDLNMVSQNYKHMLWSILAIIIMLGTIKATKAFSSVATT